MRDTWFHLFIILGCGPLVLLGPGAGLAFVYMILHALFSGSDATSLEIGLAWAVGVLLWIGLIAYMQWREVHPHHSPLE